MNDQLKKPLAASYPTVQPQNIMTKSLESPVPGLAPVPPQLYPAYRRSYAHESLLLLRWGSLTLFCRNVLLRGNSDAANLARIRKHTSVLPSPRSRRVASAHVLVVVRRGTPVSRGYVIRYGAAGQSPLASSCGIFPIRWVVEADALPGQRSGSRGSAVRGLGHEASSY